MGINFLDHLEYYKNEFTYGASSCAEQSENYNLKRKSLWNNSEIDSPFAEQPKKYNLE